MSGCAMGFQDRILRLAVTWVFSVKSCGWLCRGFSGSNPAYSYAMGFQGRILRLRNQMYYYHLVRHQIQQYRLHRLGNFRHGTKYSPMVWPGTNYNIIAWSGTNYDSMFWGWLPFVTLSFMYSTKCNNSFFTVPF